MISNVHYVRPKGENELYIIQELNWKGQSVKYKVSDGLTYIIPFSSVDFLLDTDPEVDQITKEYFNNNY